MDFKRLIKASPKQLRSGLNNRIKSAVNPERYRALPLQPELTSASTKLLIGPANFAGQAFAWARAAEHVIPDFQAESLTRTVGTFSFPTDDAVSPFLYQQARWQIRESNRILENFSHVLIEAGRPVTGYLHGRTVAGEIDFFTKAGISCAVLSHGSDTRVPSHHLNKYSSSPFNQAPPEVFQTLENRALTLIAIYQELNLPVFVSTPDLMDDLPQATWLPVVVDVSVWKCDGTPTNSRPRVLFAPSKSWIKGGPRVDELLQGLADRHVIDYVRVTGVPAQEMPALVKSADIVVDQFALGAYGATAVQAMAAGKTVIGHIAPWVRERIPSEVPIVESGLDDLEEKIQTLVANKELRDATGTRGVSFVNEYHDGRYAGEILRRWIQTRS